MQRVTVLHRFVDRIGARGAIHDAQPPGADPTDLGRERGSADRDAIPDPDPTHVH